MKSKNQLRLLASSLVFCASTASSVPIDTVAAGAWNTATPWGSVPASGNDYRITGFNVTTPNASGTYTFAGDSLELASNELQLKQEHNGTQTGTYNIANFTMSGGALVFDASNGTSTWNFNSGINFAASTTSKLIIRDGNYATTANLNGAITGSGNIVVESNRSDTNDDRAYFYLKSANSTFSGNWTAQGYDTGEYTNIRAAAANALGTGTVTLLDRGSLLVDVDNGIDSTAGVILDHSAARFNLSNRNWTNAAGILTVNNGTVNMGTGVISLASMSQAAGTINLSVGGPVSGLLDISGTADLTGGSIAVTLQGDPTGKTYDILKYGGSLTGTPNFTLNGDSGRLTASFDNGSLTADKVTLSFTGSVGNLVWTGATSDAWDNNTTQNFTNGGSPDVFRSFDNVIFDDSTTFNSPLLTGSLSCGVLTFAGVSDYILAGAGNLAGGTSISKTGSHTLSISNTTANTYIGNVTITGGTLKAGSATALGAAVVGGGTYVSGGGTLDNNGLNLGAELVTIADTGVGGNGAIVNSAASQTQALRFVTLSGDASIGGTGRWDIRGATTATLNLAGYKLTKVGTNLISLVATNVTNGDIDVNEGTLAFSTTTKVNGTGTVKVNSGGNLEIGYGTVGANITRDIVLNGGTLSSLGTASAANSNISLTAASIISNAGALTLSGNLTESGGAHTLTKTGTSDLTVSGTGSTRTGETIIDNGYLFVTSNNALGSGKITIGQTTLGSTNHGLRLNGVTIDNDVDAQYSFTGDYKGSITAIGGSISTINGDVTFLPLLAGAASRGGELASDATAGSVLRLMGELNVGGGRTSITQRDGVVEYGGGASTSYTLGITNTARLAANNGIGSGVTVNLGVSASATLDLRGYNTSVESVTRHGNTTWVQNDGSADSTLTVTPTADRIYSGGIRDNSGATSNKLSLVKDGSFTYTLSGNNSYTGTTTVNGGKLLLSSSHAAVTGDFIVNSGTLGSNNTVGGAITVKSGGSLAPGINNIGQITTSGTVILESGSTFAAEINSSAVTSDLLFANADVTLTGATLNISDIAASSTPITAGTKLTLIDYGTNTLTGTFDGLAEGATVTSGSNTFTISYVDGDQVTLTSTTVATPYVSWSVLQGLDGTAGKDPAFDADPDGDGYDNGLEWILGGDPLSGADAPLVQATATASGGLTLTFNREEDSIGQATLTVEIDTDLEGTWATFATVGATSAGSVTIDTAPDPDAVSVNIPASNALNGKLFGRLRATQP